MSTIMYIRMKNLVYTLVTYNTDMYVRVLRVFLESLICYSPGHLHDYHMLIITDRRTRSMIERLPEAMMVSLLYLLVDEDQDLFHGLIHKFDIIQYVDYMKYDKIMYIDCDIVVQGELLHIFDAVKAERNVLYAPAEGTLDGKFWSLGAYEARDYERLKKRGTKSFNSGTFLFIPTEEMKVHFRNARDLALSYRGKKYFDQSFFNYYFNMRHLSSTMYIGDYVKISPDPTKYYPYKILIHHSGIGECEEKPRTMSKYLNDVKRIRQMK
jgi:Glycosyl transferase family 8